MDTALEAARTTTPNDLNQLAHFSCVRCYPKRDVGLCGTKLQGVEASPSDPDCVICDELERFRCPRCKRFPT